MIRLSTLYFILKKRIALVFSQNSICPKLGYFQIYSFGFLPKINFSKIRLYCKVISLVFSQNSIPQKLGYFQVYSFVFYQKFTCPKLVFQGYSLGFLTKNQFFQNWTLLQSYNLSFFPKLNPSKIGLFPSL